jgi:hypothetical protein
VRRDTRRVPGLPRLHLPGEALLLGALLAAPLGASTASAQAPPAAAPAATSVPPASPDPDDPALPQAADEPATVEATRPTATEGPQPATRPTPPADTLPKAVVDEDQKTAAEPPPPDDGPKDPNQPPGYADGFHFGSYGRVIAGGDATGRPGRDADIVARGSRLDESNYAELELRREDYWKKTGAYTRIVATAAFANPFFHYNGQFAAAVALRNLYIEETGLGAKGLSIWAGSRMYRGDDIYLLNFWPLDNLNTLGGGLGYAFGNGQRTSIRVHAGLNQPTDPYYRQSVMREPAHNQFDDTEVRLLDRQKLISSAKLTHLWPLSEAGGIKGIVYGEFHYVPGGQREVEAKLYEDVPKDTGFVAGGQLTLFTGKRSTYVTATGRFAYGLAAYGEFNAPRQLRPNRKTTGAYEMMLTLSGNWERGPFAIMAGGYYRQFRNASKSLDFDDINEGIVIARPTVWFGEKAGLSLEGSFQAQQRGVTWETGPGLFKPVIGTVGRAGILPFVTPGGRGHFQRPHIYLMYVFTARDTGARSLYASDDVFARRKIDHLIGLGAEWWFGSTSYFRD